MVPHAAWSDCPALTAVLLTAAAAAAPSVQGAWRVTQMASRAPGATRSAWCSSTHPSCPAATGGSPWCEWSERGRVVAPAA
jgi:hypothetical protein